MLVSITYASKRVFLKLKLDVGLAFANHIEELQEVRLSCEMFLTVLDIHLDGLSSDL
jgi:hypothetical protein